MNAFFTRVPGLRLAAGLLLALTFFASCEKDVTLKTLDVKLQSDLEMNVTASDPTSGIWADTLDPDGNADVRDNRNKIQEITISKLAYTVDAHFGDSTITGSGTWKFYPADNPADAQAISTVTAINFADLDASDAERDLNISEAAKAKIVQLINDKKKVVFAFEGTVSNKPVWARFNMRIYTKIKIGL